MSILYANTTSAVTSPIGSSIYPASFAFTNATTLASSFPSLGAYSSCSTCIPGLPGDVRVGNIVPSSFTPQSVISPRLPAPVPTCSSPAQALPCPVGSPLTSCAVGIPPTTLGYVPTTFPSYQLPFAYGNRLTTPVNQVGITNPFFPTAPSTTPITRTLTYSSSGGSNLAAVPLPF